MAALAALAAPALAQDVSAQKVIYQQVEKNLAACKKVDGNAMTGEVLNAWINSDGNIVKLVATSTGRTEEYYAGPDGKLAYIHLNWGDDDGHRVDERIYLTSSTIAKWLANGEEDTTMSPAEVRESFANFQKNFASYSRDLAPGESAAAPAATPADQPATESATAPAPDAASKSPAADASEAPAPKTFASTGAGGEIHGSTLNVTEGKFLRIDEGDYFHWVMKDAETGDEVSYFIIKPDASVEAVTDNPEKFVGKKCRVTWKESTENLPEAGGKTDVQQILSVTWTK